MALGMTSKKSLQPVVSPTPTEHSEILRASVLFLVTIFLFACGYFWIEHRLWGVGAWAYLPPWFALAVAVTAVGGLICVYGAARSRHFVIASGDTSVRTPMLLFGTLVALLFVTFILLRQTVHFLGDGYQQLSRIASEQVPMVQRSLGENLIHWQLRAWIGGEGKRAALLSYQILSIGSGVIFLSLSALFAASTWPDIRRRLIFTLGMASGGYALLFFGYVENYTLLCLAIGIFTFTGIRVARGEWSCWWILLPLAFAVCLHVLGVTLLPAAVYVCISGTKMAAGLRRMSRITRSILIVLLLLALGVTYAWLARDNYYVRFAIVPLVENRFTVAHYTMFSWDHLLDFVNLIFLLVPGILVVMAAANRGPWRKVFRKREYIFLLVLVTSTLGAAFLLEAKLGMPRDWDLFSFPGISLTVLIMYTLLSTAQTRAHLATPLLCIMIGFVALLPRSLRQHVPEYGIAQFAGYHRLDRLKNRSGMSVLSSYYLERGDTSLCEATEAARKQDHPEEVLSARADTLFQSRLLSEYKATADSIIRLNPGFFAGWVHLGRYYTVQKQLDSAVEALLVAEGLNPHTPRVLNELGLAYALQGRIQKAEDVWKESLVLKLDQYYPYEGLARIYRRKGDMTRFGEFAVKAAHASDAEGSTFKLLGDYYRTQGQVERALAAYAEALRRGVDSATAGQIRAIQSRAPKQ